MINKLIIDNQFINLKILKNLDNIEINNWVSKLITKYNIKKDFSDSNFKKDYKIMQANLELIANSISKINNYDLLTIFILDRQYKRYIRISKYIYIFRTNLFYNYDLFNVVLIDNLVKNILKSEISLNSYFTNTFILKYFKYYVNNILVKDKDHDFFVNFIKKLNNYFYFDHLLFLNNSESFKDYIENMNNNEFLYFFTFVNNIIQIDIMIDKFNKIKSEFKDNNDLILVYYNNLLLEDYNKKEIIKFLNNLIILKVEFKDAIIVNSLMGLIIFFHKDLSKKSIIINSNQIFYYILSKLEDNTYNINSSEINRIKLFYLFIQRFSIINNFVQKSKAYIITEYMKTNDSFQFKTSKLEKQILYYLKKFDYNIKENVVLDNFLEIDAIDINNKVIIEINGIHHFNFYTNNFNLSHKLKFIVIKYLLHKYKLVNINYFTFYELRNDLDKIENYLRNIIN